MYVGAFGYYEGLISCTPYRGSCPDCYEMNRSAQIIGRMTGEAVTTLSQRRMSPASMTALERMKTEFNECCTSK